jgi:prevent-host-death family protein
MDQDRADDASAPADLVAAGRSPPHAVVDNRMKIASVADVKARLSAYLKQSQEGPIIITRNGKAVAVLLAVTDEDELERLVLAHSPKFQAILDRSRRQIDESGGIPHDDFWRDVEAENAEHASKGTGVRRRTRRRT